jgi:hypothetical protein
VKTLSKQTLRMTDLKNEKWALEIFGRLIILNE